MNEQYIQSLDEHELQEQAHPPPVVPVVAVANVVENTQTVPDQPIASMEPAAVSAAPQQSSGSESSDEDEENSEQTNQDKGADSPSLLIDAFLRTNEQSANTLSTQLNEEFNISTNQSSSALNADNNDDDMEGCLTISLPSPRSLLNTH